MSVNIREISVSNFNVIFVLKYFSVVSSSSTLSSVNCHQSRVVASFTLCGSIIAKVIECFAWLGYFFFFNIHFWQGYSHVRNQNIFLHFKRIMNIVKVLGTILCVVRLSLKIFCLLHR